MKLVIIPVNIYIYIIYNKMKFYQINLFCIDNLLNNNNINTTTNNNNNNGFIYLFIYLFIYWI